jgi:hypothetical protein
VPKLGLSRERVWRWAVAQTLAWAVSEDGVIEEQVDLARQLRTIDGV